MESPLVQSLLGKLPEIEAKLRYAFKNSSLLLMAFTHRSFFNEDRSSPEHNERLEFLGDSVLGLLIADYLYNKFPATPEGELSTLRAHLVDGASCVAFVLRLDVSHYLLLGRGEKMNDGRGRETILADLFEAIIGAIYLDGGFDAARSFLFDNFLPSIEETVQAPQSNWKAMLQDYCQKKRQVPPTYLVLEESGPDHSKRFVIAVTLDEQELGRGVGSSKKEAQQAAAQDAMRKIQGY